MCLSVVFSVECSPHVMYGFNSAGTRKHYDVLCPHDVGSVKSVVRVEQVNISGSVDDEVYLGQQVAVILL